MRFCRRLQLLVGLVAAVVAFSGCAPSQDAVASPPQVPQPEAPEVEVLPSGRDAFAAAEGTPTVLFFWGAH